MAVTAKRYLIKTLGCLTDFTSSYDRLSDRFAFRFLFFPGGYTGEVTPVPIPNTEVKPRWADGTARVSVWEIR